LDSTGIGEEILATDSGVQEKKMPKLVEYFKKTAQCQIEISSSMKGSGNIL